MKSIPITFIYSQALFTFLFFLIFSIWTQVSIPNTFPREPTAPSPSFLLIFSRIVISREDADETTPVSC